MWSLKTVLVGLLSVTGSSANPVLTSSKIRRVTTLNISPYPLGQPCPGEWQYMNFNPRDNTDNHRLRRLHHAVCEDIPRIIAAGEDAVSRVNAVYTRYFAKSNQEDDYQGHVTSVYNMLFSRGRGGLNPLVGSFIVDNKDFNAGSESDFCAEGALAYTENDHNDLREKTHFCTIAYESPNIDTLQCSAFDRYPSEKMDTLSRIGLHEMFHYSSVGPKSSLHEQIIDARNEDGFGAFEADRAHGLVDPEQDDNPALAEINADNYAWSALDAYWSRECSRDPLNYGHYFQSPPPYERESGDGDEAA